MKTWTYLLSQCITLLLLSTSSPVFAATTQAAVPSRLTTTITSTEAEGHWHHPTNNQFVGGRCLNRRIIKTYRGNNLSNTGNRGYNRGRNQDNSGNEANAIINQRQGQNQYYQHCLNIDVHQHYFGNNQSNSGNGGYNSGFTQDNSGNEGNLVVN